MRPAPRASFSITILTDEDYCNLMARPDGPATFGVFVAMVLVGRDRLAQGRASQISQSEALRIDGDLAFIASLARLKTKQVTRCAEVLGEIASETGGQPWMFLDETQHVVIRSFFKFNTSTGWGGPRPNSGRPSKNQVVLTPGNQDETKMVSDGNQLETNLNPSCFVSGSGLGIGSSNPLPPTGGAVAVKSINSPAETDAVSQWANQIVTGWGPLAEGACLTYPAAWVREACSIARESKASRWKYVDGILGRFQTQGGPDSAQPNGNPRAAPRKPEPERPEDRIHRAPRPQTPTQPEGTP